MAGEKCPFCAAFFDEQSAFWDHLNKGSCQNIGPSKSTDINITHPSDINNSISRNEVPSTPSPIANHLSQMGNRTENGDRNERLLFNSNNTPEELKLSENNPAQSTMTRANNENLFSKREFPQNATLSKPTSSVKPVWKCTLCNLDFTEKQAMINHAKSPEHEAKLLSNTLPVNSCSLTNSLPKPVNSVPPSSSPSRSTENTSTININKEELISIVREVVREELQKMFQSYFDNTRCAESPLPTGESNCDTKFIRSNGNSIFCEVCECQLTSLGSLNLHVEGRRHKSNVARKSLPYISG